MNKKANSGLKIICLNRKASFNFFFEDLIEAGIVLKGSEIKSIREGKVNIAIFTFPSLMDLISDPLRTIPASIKSSKKKLKLAFLFKQIIFKPELAFLFIRVDLLILKLF